MYQVPIHFFLLSALLVVFLLGLATLFRLYAPKVPYSTAVIGLWSFLVSLLYFCDYMELRLLGVLSALGVLFLLTIVDASWRFKHSLFLLYKERNQFTKLVGLFLVWLAALGALSVPLFFAFPADAVITGYNIVNDGVTHACLARGFTYTRLRELSPAFAWGMQVYPRGAHSFLFFMNHFLKVDSARLLLPGIIFAYSLIIFALEPLIDRSRIQRASLRGFILIASSAPFLSLVGIYLLFVSHSFTIPIALAAVISIFTFDRSKEIGWQLFITCLLALGSLVAYGIFPISIIAAAIVIKAAFSIKFNWGFCRVWLRELAKLPQTIRSNISLWPLLLLLLGIISASPAIGNTVSLVFYLFSATPSENVFSTGGNLPQHLSFLHLTGLWPTLADYRENFGGKRFEYTLLLTFVVQLFFIFHAVGRNSNAGKPPRAMHLTLGCLSAFPLAAAMLIPGAYVHYKYLAFLVPLFTFSAITCLVEFSPRQSLPWRSFCLLVMGFYLYGSAVLPRMALHPQSIINESFWDTLTTLSHEYMDKGNTLVLTKEDWIQFFITDSIDGAPLTQYMYRPWREAKLDFLIVDNKIEALALSYLQPFPRIIKRMEDIPAECVRIYAQRFKVFDFKCRRQRLPT